jgi:hypothetical protein
MSNTFGPESQHVPFDRLPDAGHPTMKMVDGRLIDREEYDTVGYRLEEIYQTDTGRDVAVWRASLDGLIRYGRLKATRREQAIAAARTRREYEDEEGDRIAALIDAKPNYPGRGE